MVSKRKNRFFGITSRVLMLIVAGLLALSYVSIVINPAKIWLATLLGLFFVPLSILNVILLLWAIKRKSKSFLIPLLSLLPSFFFLGRYVQFDDNSIGHADDPTMKMISYNVGRFSSCTGRKECVDSVMAFIKKENADIVCLQEFHVRNVNKVRNQITEHLKDYSADYYIFPLADGSAFGNVTLSRIPVKNKGKIRFEGSANMALYTDYELEGRRFRVYNCHFESYNISFTGIIKRLFNADRTVLHETGSKMKKSIMRRPKQVDKVFDNIESCPIESFVCGDFNDNPMSYSYNRMIKGRKDAFVESGKGFGATYNKLWPMLRIDYILFPERFDAIYHSIPRLSFSDHYPVIAEIEL